MFHLSVEPMALKFEFKWLLRGYVCVYHPAAAGSNPKHTIYAFFNLYYWNCIEEIMKINKKRQGLAQIKKQSVWPDLNLLWQLWKFSLMEIALEFWGDLIKCSLSMPESCQLTNGCWNDCFCLNCLLPGDANFSFRQRSCRDADVTQRHSLFNCRSEYHLNLDQTSIPLKSLTSFGKDI